MPANWFKTFGWKAIQNYTEGGLWLLLVFQSWGISPGFALSCGAGRSTDARVGLSRYKLMTRVLCSYCSLSFRLKADTLSSGDEGAGPAGSQPACMKEICANSPPHQIALQLGLMLAFFDFWASIGVVWKTGTDCSAQLGRPACPRSLA